MIVAGHTGAFTKQTIHSEYKGLKAQNRDATLKGKS